MFRKHSKSISYFLIIILACTASCKSKKQPAQTTTQEQVLDLSKQGYEKAKVISYPIDGCSFMIQLESGKKLEPINLIENFKKDDLAVWVKFQSLKEAMSVCMAGEIVKILAIEERK